MRRVSTLVLPEPAPATTSNGPPRWTTAARWGRVSPSSSAAAATAIPPPAGIGQVVAGGLERQGDPGRLRHLGRRGGTAAASSSNAPSSKCAVLEQGVVVGGGPVVGGRGIGGRVGVAGASAPAPASALASALAAPPRRAFSSVPFIAAALTWLNASMSNSWEPLLF